MRCAWQQLQQVYDARIRSLRLEWATGEAYLDLEVRFPGLGPVDLCIHASSASLLHCIRREAAGPALALRSIRSRATRGGGTRVEFEDEQGQLLAVDACSIHVEVTA